MCFCARILKDSRAERRLRPEKCVIIIIMASKKLRVTTSDKQIPVVSFTNGTVKPSRKRKLTVTALQDGSHKGSAKRKKMMVVESDKMTYKGDNYGPLSVPEPSMQLFVARVNRQTGEATLFPSERFQLHPVTQVDLQREQMVLETMSYSEKNDILTDAFGSRKGKRAVIKRQKSHMVKDTVTSAMGSALDTALASHTPLPAAESQETSSAIPPYNKDAQTPAEVYSLSDIVGPAEIDSLANNAEVLKNCTALTLREWTEKKEYAKSVLSRLACLPMDEEQRQERACLLLYLHYLITFFHLKSDQIRKKEPLPQEWPDPIKRMMLDRFTVKVDGKAKRCVPQRVKDLLLSHILVLCLIVDGFTTPLTHLMPDLKVSVTRLHNHVRALGCRVKVDSSAKEESGAKVSSSVAVLTVPLTFPEPFKKRKKN